MSAGVMGPLGEVTDMTLVVALILAIPAMMIFLSAALPAVVSRWNNVVLGIGYTAIAGLTFMAPPLYQMVVGFEIVVTVLIIWTALRWQRVE